MQWLINIAKEWFQLYLQGMIVLWSGAIVDIPDGWHLCDGTNGTPNMQDKFVPGAGSSYAPNAIGGSLNHEHPFTGDGHDHWFGQSIQVSAIGIHQAWSTGLRSNERPAVGTTDPTSTLPTFYALAYIMRL